MRLWTRQYVFIDTMLPHNADKDSDSGSVASDIINGTDGFDDLKECCRATLRLLFITLRVLTILCMMIVFWVLPFIEYSVKDKQFDSGIRVRDSLVLADLPTCNMFAWTNLKAENSHHNNVLDTHSYDTFTIFAPLLFNVTLWIYWFLKRALLEERDAMVVILGMAIVLDSLTRMLQATPGIYGMRQDEDPGISTIIGFVVRDTGPRSVSIRMGWTLFLLRDFLIHQLGFVTHELIGHIIHLCLALFLWAYTNYTHQLEPISIINNLGIAYWMVYVFRVCTNPVVKEQEVKAVQEAHPRNDDRAQKMIQRIHDLTVLTARERMNRELSAGMKHVPERMLATGVQEPGVGHEAVGGVMDLDTDDSDSNSGSDAVVEMGTFSDLDVDERADAYASGSSSYDSSMKQSEQLLEDLQAMTSSRKAERRQRRQREARKKEKDRPRPRPPRPQDPAPAPAAPDPQPAAVDHSAVLPSPTQTAQPAAVQQESEEQTLLADPYPLEDEA